MYVRTQSATPRGIDGECVEVEAKLYRSLPKIQVTGLPSDVVKESRDRICGALASLGFSQIPNQKIVIHLSPAALKKEGSQFDLPMAIALLAVEGKVANREKIRRSAFFGELGLDGGIKPVRAVISLTQALLHRKDIDFIVVPKSNSMQVSLLCHSKVRVANHLRDVVHFLSGGDLPEACYDAGEEIPEAFPRGVWDQIVGQALGKRAIQIAAAGWHPLLLVGPPGVGKSLLSKCVGDLLPELADGERVEVVKAHSLLDAGALGLKRPFRSPHHSSPAAAILGGGSRIWSPGEVTLAHRGVLFLDELPEFRRDVLEGLREPLEEGCVHVRRIQGSQRFPARFLLIAAMNPCPCGASLDEGGRCRCLASEVLKYRRRISGPLLDRFDVLGVLGRPQWSESGPTLEDARASVLAAIERQRRRYRCQGIRFNGEFAIPDHPDFCLDPKDEDWLKEQSHRHFQSLRALNKCIKLARTIADLAEKERIERCDLQEAWALRCRDF